MTTRRAGARRWALRHTPAMALDWPFEWYCIATSTVVALLTLLLSILPAAPTPSLAHTMGLGWAVSWSVLALLSAAIIYHGLTRNHLDGVVVGLRMYGTLILAYFAITQVFPPFPVSVLGGSLMLTTGALAIARATYIALAGPRRRR